MSGKSDFISDGYALEHRVVGYLESDGWFAIKSHMSRGIVDVVGIKPKGQVIFVQCKLSGNNKKELDELKKLKKKFPLSQVKYAKLGINNQIEFKDIENIKTTNQNENNLRSKMRLAKNKLDELSDWGRKNVKREKVLDEVEITEDILKKLKERGMIDIPKSHQYCPSGHRIFEPKPDYIQVI